MFATANPTPPQPARASELSQSITDPGIGKRRRSASPESGRNGGARGTVWRKGGQGANRAGCEDGGHSMFKKMLGKARSNFLFAATPIAPVRIEGLEDRCLMHGGFGGFGFGGGGGGFEFGGGFGDGGPGLHLG